MEVRIESLQDINWDEIYPAEDILIWNDEKWQFSDLVGHFPGFIGPVIESAADEKIYIDVGTGIRLTFYSIEDSFLGDKSEGSIDFLLPAAWADEQLQNWKEQYIIDRLAQEDTAQLPVQCGQVLCRRHTDRALGRGRAGGVVNPERRLGAA